MCFIVLIKTTCLVVAIVLLKKKKKLPAALHPSSSMILVWSGANLDANIFSSYHGGKMVTAWSSAAWGFMYWPLLFLCPWGMQISINSFQVQSKLCWCNATSQKESFEQIKSVILCMLSFFSGCAAYRNSSVSSASGEDTEGNNDTDELPHSACWAS